MADCSVERGRSLALRRRLAPRNTAANRVSSSAQPARKSVNPGATPLASSAARTKPDAMPMRVKLISVSGVCHSAKNRKQA